MNFFFLGLTTSGGRGDLDPDSPHEENWAVPLNHKSLNHDYAFYNKIKGE
jgi:hypothetical protein